MTKQWVFGVLMQNVWDFAGDGDHNSVDQFLTQRLQFTLMFPK